MPPASRPVVREIPVGRRDSAPCHVIVGPEAALWPTLIHSGQAARMTTHGPRQLHQVGQTSSQPSIIAAGPDGALWFSLNQADAIRQITAAGEVRAFEIRTSHASIRATWPDLGDRWRQLRRPGDRPHRLLATKNGRVGRRIDGFEGSGE